jgi:hydrogenase maturation protein HypF
MLCRLDGSSAADSKLLTAIDPTSRKAVAQMIENDFNSPLTSSCGRLFDGLAALLGLCLVSTFEGQAAMQLEASARQALTSDWKDVLIDQISGAEGFLRQENTQRWEIISSEFVNKARDDISSGIDRSVIALQFHSWLISCLSRLVEKVSVETGISDVVLSGGCMQNTILLEGLLFSLSELGLRPYTGTQIPINDGGISVGQAVIGGLQHVSCSTDES